MDGPLSEIIVHIPASKATEVSEIDATRHPLIIRYIPTIRTVIALVNRLQRGSMNPEHGGPVLGPGRIAGNQRRCSTLVFHHLSLAGLGHFVGRLFVLLGEILNFTFRLIALVFS